MREIILDTETTGLSPNDGHRIIEIGCVELFNCVPTGRTFQCYINPERDVPPQSTAITGLTTEFLKPFPVFSKVVDDFLDFIQDDQLVIHNAKFDLTFLNFELSRLGLAVLPQSRAVDTLLIARQKFPGSPASLDALCKRFNVDLGKRNKHGALLDSELLAIVYLELLGGRQRTLAMESSRDGPAAETVEIGTKHVKRAARIFEIFDEEAKAHKEFLGQIKNPLWSQY
ncbi:MAG: DNA polymerase III subunit epsilon [Alphaproteobacteria bacterium]|nr:DNA polymerase III subunit epsilon [Alphaproteobacteria bacterium]